ncbi:MAG TPA: thrombospondin type 3 repeat-containing protein [Verrucomicrobiae bacterium]|nr:thrombospondin type 3 repeat-containing protein [Verrucomicrobiae bacterium]
MTISNLIISAPVVHEGMITFQGLNELLVENTGSATFNILNTVLLSTGSVMTVSNSPVIVRSQLSDNGYMELDNGAVLTTTSPCVSYVGYDRVAQFAVTGGVWQTGNSYVGYNYGSTGLLEVSSGTVTFQDNTDLYIGYNSGASGQLTMSGGTLQATNSDIFIGYFSGSSGSITLSGGQLLVPDNALEIGYEGAGQVTVEGGYLSAGYTSLGFQGSDAATLTISGGTADLGLLDIAAGNYSAGSVWLTGGQLLVSNYDTSTIVGDADFTSGQMIVSNGYWLTAAVQIGNTAYANGTLTIAGGTNIIFAPQNGSGTPFMHVGREGGFGHLWITGGLLLCTNGTTIVGDQGGYGQIVVSNGDYISKFIFLGDSGASNCLMNLYGGTTTIYSNLNIGRFDCQAAGIVTVAGGTLYVTNAQHNAALDIETGTFALNSDIVVADTIVMTNSCGTFIHTGGTFVYGSAILTPDADADGDGIPNGYEQAHGLDPLDPTDAAKDNDGDGQNNLQEYLAGTDPNDSTSAFRITNLLVTNQDVLVTWMTGVGKTNALQAATSGSYATNGFADIFTVTNTTGIVTNYLDVGGATNEPARFYRVRLIP